MVTRIITAIVGIPLFLGALFLGGFYLQALVALLVFFGLIEFGRLISPVYWDFLFISGLSYLTISYSSSNSTYLFLWLVVLLLYFLIRSAFSTQKPLAAAANLLGVFYVPVLYSFIWLVRMEYGFSMTLFALIITWLTDTGAYFVGSAWGKHRLAPRISPKKSWEGAAGGVLTALVGGVAFGLITSNSVAPLVLLSVILSAVGQIGDLAESAMKREAGVKDSGAILPGHGGILDRFDSLVFVLPTLYLLLSI